VPGTNTPTPISNETNRGYICPKGHYCPENSYEETPCPAGTYSKFVNAKSIEECYRCRVGQYQDQPGADGCKKCGPSATTGDEGGATVCTCMGANRKYMMSSGSCVCATGYKPKNDGDPTMDSPTDCEAEVKEACAPGVQTDVFGNCNAAGVDPCEAQCGAEGGTVVQGTGLC
jgi:hypothetical protein